MCFKKIILSTNKKKYEKVKEIYKLNEKKCTNKN